MVYQLKPHLARAQNLINAGDPASLQYAALELRLALERYAYRKLSMRLASVPHEELRKWQPKRVIETLMELVEPDIDQSKSYSVSPEDAAGNPTTFHRLGEVKGVSAKDVGAHWQKLGSMLHAKMPTTKNEPTQEFSARLLRPMPLAPVAIRIPARLKFIGNKAVPVGVNQPGLKFGGDAVPVAVHQRRKVFRD